MKYNFGMQVRFKFIECRLLDPLSLPIYCLEVRSSWKVIALSQSYEKIYYFIYLTIVCWISL